MVCIGLSWAMGKKTIKKKLRKLGQRKNELGMKVKKNHRREDTSKIEWGGAG